MYVLEPQSWPKNWVGELKLGTWGLPELSPSRGSNSAFRKGLILSHDINFLKSMIKLLTSTVLMFSDSTPVLSA